MQTTVQRLGGLGMLLLTLTAYGQEEENRPGYYLNVAASQSCGTNEPDSGGGWPYGVGWSTESGNEASQMAIEECSRLGGTACSACGIPSMRGGCVALVRGDGARTPKDAGAETELLSGLFSSTSTLGLAEEQALGNCETGMVAGIHGEDDVQWECVTEIVLCSEGVETRNGFVTASESGRPVAGTDATPPLVQVEPEQQPEEPPPSPQEGAGTNARGEERESTEFAFCGAAGRQRHANGWDFVRMTELYTPVHVVASGDQDGHTAAFRDYGSELTTGTYRLYFPYCKFFASEDDASDELERFWVGSEEHISESMAEGRCKGSCTVGWLEGFVAPGAD